MSAVIGNPLLLPTEGYQISRSVRIRDSASGYFSRTPASQGNRRTWTWSGWVKRGTLGSNRVIMSAGTSGSSTNLAFFMFNSSDAIQFYVDTGTANYSIITTQVFRDPSAWYHLVFVLDTPQATASERMKLYVNGSQVTAFSTANYTPQNNTYGINDTLAHHLGRYVFDGTRYLDGYLTEINLIDGQALTPSSFGETDSTTGVWKPKKYSGTYGTNGFYLNFSDNSNNSATTIGKDYSGNGNNWTPNNISVTSGSTYDSMIDVPTNWADGNSGRGNYAVINPLDTYLLGGANATQTISACNLNQIGTSNEGRGTVATIPVSPSGISKAYLEVNVLTGSPYFRSFSVDAMSGTAMIAVDAASGKYWMGTNGTWSGSGDPANGNNPKGTFTPAEIKLIFQCYNSGDSFAVNFGQRPFAYTPPTGFKALNTQNLPDPTIKKGNQYFDISTWTGDQSARTITNSNGMQPSFLWTKSRSTAEDHRLSDAVRGGNGTVLGTLASNTQGVEAFDTDVTGFTSNGFSIRAGTNSPNVTGRTYVGWQWKESATSGFDIVTYTGTGSARTVAHSLGVAPSMMIVKSRSYAGSDWDVYHSALGATKRVFFNTTGAAQTTSVAWNDTAPTSSVFTVGTGADVNSNTQTYVAYLFAEVAGFSKFGSYTGNGSNDGPFVFLGFRPRFIMLKNVTTAGNGAWVMFDTTRSPSNVQGLQWLFSDSSGAESTANSFGYFDILSSGFKCRGSGGNINVNGENYIYACFAENPFKYSLAR